MADADENPGSTASELVRRDSSILERFPGHLQNQPLDQPLLGVDVARPHGA